MADALPKKSPEQVMLEMKAADLKTVLSNLKTTDPIRPRKEAALKEVEAELAAFAVK